MKTFLRRILATIVYPFTAFRERCLSASTIRILTYHRVNDDVVDDRLTVRSADFKAQLLYLQERGYQSISLTEYLQMRQSKDADFSKKLIISFDDGYADNVNIALPILQDIGFTACFFVTTGYIGSDKIFPRYQDKAGDHRMMNWQELESLQAAGMEIGSHTVNHVKLAEVDHACVVAELQDSREQLSAKGFSTDLFCYPAGSYLPAVMDAVATAGYQLALTTKPGRNSATVNPYELRRTEISGADCLNGFKQKLAGAFDLQHFLLQYLYGK